MRALTGIRPTGNLHLANYFGALKPFINLKDKYELFFFVADLHALTTSFEIKELRENSYNLLAEVISLGLDTESNIVWIQSDVPEVCEFMYYLTCLTGFQYLHKGHAFKSACEQNSNPSVGLFLYPVLMAADILLYGADVVPVGKDQKQHLEICRDLAQRLRNEVGDVVKIPEPLISDTVAVVPGIDGRKMSKSYRNTIPIFASEEEIWSIVKRIQTDSTPKGDPLDLDNSIVGSYLKLVLDTAEYEKVQSEAVMGKLGWGDLKKIFYESFLRYFEHSRTVHKELILDQSRLERIAREGSEKARGYAQQMMQSIKSVRV